MILNFRMDKITTEKLDKYFDITNKAINKIKQLNKNLNKEAKIILEMAECYFNDAKHFKEKNDFVNAFACLNYAHGWLDCGARLEYYNVDGDNHLFTV